MSRARARVPIAIDLAGLAIFAVAQVVAFLPSYGNGWIWVAVLGGTALGIGISWLSQARRWSPAITALAAVAGWFVLGGLLAMPNSNIGYAVPTLRTLHGLAVGPVTAWRDMLTIAPPLGTTWNLMTIPLLLALISGLLGHTIARRSSLPTLAWLPGLIAVLAGFLLGTTHSVAPPAVGLGLLATVLIWTTLQRNRARTSLVRTASSRRLPQVVSGALVLLACCGLTWAAAPYVESAEPRMVLREYVDQPLDVRAYPSPLQGFRANISAHDDDVLFTIQGAPAGSLVRVAALDSYDALTYNVSNGTTPGQSDFVRVGARIDDPAQGQVLDLRVQIGDYSGVWLPNVGATRDIDFDGENAIALGDSLFHNMTSGTSIVTHGLTSGDAYTLEAVLPEEPTEDDIKSANAGRYDLPDPLDMPERVRDYARVWTSGASGGGEAAWMIAERFASTGWFSHGVGPDETLSLPGHSYSRISALLLDEEVMVGDEEQYAVTMALMCRSLGIPARVVYGYQVPADGSGEVRGRDVRAWTEVYLAELGWVDFNPTPDHERVLQEFEPQESTQTRPHVENPPPPPERPEVPPPDNQMPVSPVEPPPDDPTIDITQVLRTTAAVGLPVLVLIGPLVLILGLKNRRRRTRLHADTAAGRVAGGWAELLDQARDLGASISPSATRTEQAAALAGVYPKLDRKVDSNRLARQADASTFAPDPVSDEQANKFWQGIDAAVRGMRLSVTRRKALLGRLSTRSFRRFS